MVSSIDHIIEYVISFGQIQCQFSAKQRFEWSDE